ncbi:ribosomal protein L6 [Hesseltinella vesiculosa]|uniref:Large ribosomal subunit protein uL6m n=1 Tax=Hesseltinella vesiculosa TaxID=101127 RepID=A0A1X2GEW7_9FUNG|nr:ribosomal protein L6 [Hesseltinella vesiculosa]
MLRSSMRRVHSSFIHNTRSFNTSAVVASHIGRTPVTVASNVTVHHDLTPIQHPRIPSELNNTTLTVKGPLGELSMPIKPFVQLTMDKSVQGDDLVKIAIQDQTNKKQKSMWGTTRNLIRNMITGVSEGYQVHLRLVGVGYRAVLENDKRSVSLKLGYSHPIVIDLPQGVTCTVPIPNRMILHGIDLQQVTELAAKIQRWRKPEPYNQKGIFINDETIKKKEGKKK